MRLAVVLLFAAVVHAGHFGQQAPIVTGQPPFQYQYEPQLLALPASVQMLNGHGLAKDSAGNIYFTFQPVSVETQTRVLVRFNPDGTGGTLLGDDNRLAYGVPHGLRIRTEADGMQYLYHANNDATVHKTFLNGSIIWTANETQAWSGSPYWPFKPTDAVVPNTDPTNLYVTDGYGRGFIHVLQGSNGVYTNKTFGGAGNSTVPPRFNTPHGINYDPRRGLVVISDRANARLVYVNIDGSYNSSVAMPEALALPCNVDFGFDNVHALVPNLGSYVQAGSNSNGTVGVLDANNNVISVLEIAKLLGDQGHMHPHDAIFLDNGDIVVCCWSPGTISYWRRLPTQ